MISAKKILGCTLACAALLSFSAHALEDDQTNTSDAAETIKRVPDSVDFLQTGDAVYVSDAANVWLRTCPSTQCRITAVTHVGEKFTFVKLSEDKKFVLVDDGTKQLWMQYRDLQVAPCGKTLVDIKQGRIDELENKLANYDSEVAKDYQAAKAKLEKLEKENAKLKDTVAKQTEQIEELDATRRDYADKLQTKELDMQMRWWMQGAIIAFSGAVIGIICVFIPRPNRRKKQLRF
ncbi:MAG: TIGR04211 family SH3 domain-containing protein [Succinivibrio sp.]